MAQGFKGKKPASSSSKPRKPQQTKKGGRSVAPKKASAVAERLQKKKHSKSVNGEIEKLMVNRADGKLSIMKALKEDKPVPEKAKPVKAKSEGEKR